MVYIVFIKWSLFCFHVVKRQILTRKYLQFSDNQSPTLKYKKVINFFFLNLSTGGNHFRKFTIIILGEIVNVLKKLNKMIELEAENYACK